MPKVKMKTKGSIKGRFKRTASGKIKRTQAGKRHGMTKRNPRMLRDATGTTLVADADSKRFKIYAPYL